MSTNKKQKWLIPLLLVFLGVSVFFVFKKSQDLNQLESAFKEEKQDLEADLDEVVKNYQTAIDDKLEISGRLELELNKIVQLRDSVKQLKGTNYKLIRKYKKRIKILEEQNKVLFAKVDSLRSVNSDLTQENLLANQMIVEKDSLNKNLTEVNTALEETKTHLQAKVAKASVIKTSAITIVAMKERSNGKLTSTSRSSRTDAFKVNFELLKNDIADPGKRNIYVQIKDKNGKIVAKKGEVVFEESKKLSYSDLLVADYRNQPLSIVSLVQVNRDDIDGGKYTVNAFIDNVYVGSAAVDIR